MLRLIGAAAVLALAAANPAFAQGKGHGNGGGKRSRRRSSPWLARTMAKATAARRAMATRSAVATDRAEMRDSAHPQGGGNVERVHDERGDRGRMDRQCATIAVAVVVERTVVRDRGDGNCDRQDERNCDRVSVMAIGIGAPTGIVATGSMLRSPAAPPASPRSTTAACHPGLAKGGERDDYYRDRYFGYRLPALAVRHSDPHAARTTPITMVT